MLLLGALCLRDGRVADVLADGHAGLFGGAGEQSLLVVGEADGQHLGSRVAGRWPAGAGTHGHEVTVSHGVTKCYTSCDTESLADREFVLYDKSMTATARPTRLINRIPGFEDVVLPTEIDPNQVAADRRTALELLTEAMRTNPDLIRSVVELDDDHPDLDHLDPNGDDEQAATR